ncbi:MAG TPA: polysaccharide deacetylase family protein [Candidatus Limnocylindrales bacterium]|nr:polysaccharide deacetylase family protein [Candidatus Limnocylindrales bacterium]
MKLFNIKNLLCKTAIFLRRAMYISSGMLSSFVHGSDQNVYVVSYHSIAEDNWRFSIDTAQIKKQISYLSEKFDIIDLKTLEKIIQGKKKVLRPSIAITFDDGYKDILKLKKFFSKKNIKPAVFLLADPKNANWKELGSKRRFLNLSEIASLYNSGFEIGSHSNTHSNLSTLETKSLDNEILGSKKLLEKTLGITIKYFAYPRGKYNSTVVQKVKKAGYRLALTMDDSHISVDTDPLLVPRIGIDRTHSFEEFKYLFARNNINMRMIVKKSYIGRYI